MRAIFAPWKSGKMLPPMPKERGNKNSEEIYLRNHFAALVVALISLNHEKIEK